MAKKYSTRKTRSGTGARQENQLIKRFTKIPKKKAEALEKVSEQFLRDYIEFTKYENGLPAKLLEKPHRALVLIEREMIESGDWFETSANKKKYRAALKKVEIICKLVWKKELDLAKATAIAVGRKWAQRIGRIQKRSREFVNEGGNPVLYIFLCRANNATQSDTISDIVLNMVRDIAPPTVSFGKNVFRFRESFTSRDLARSNSPRWTYHAQFRFNFNCDRAGILSANAFITPTGTWSLTAFYSNWAPPRARVTIEAFLTITKGSDVFSGPVVTILDKRRSGVETFLGITTTMILNGTASGPLSTHETTLDAPPLFVIAGDSLVFAVNVKVVLFASHGASVSMDAKSGSNFGINVPSVFATITG